MLALNAYTLIKSIHRLNSKHPKLATFIDKKSDNFPHISPVLYVWSTVPCMIWHRFEEGEIQFIYWVLEVIPFLFG